LVTDKLPVTPVLSGRPVAFVSVTEVGVPKTGVVSVGDIDKTLLPEPVDVVTPVPPAATGKVPAARAVLEVEYRALLAPVKVVSPVPP
jgi:hypothetical protein